jgi:hypothetical protein
LFVSFIIFPFICLWQNQVQQAATFLHIARPDMRPTDGCIALSLEDVSWLLEQGLETIFVPNYLHDLCHCKVGHLLVLGTFCAYLTFFVFFIFINDGSRQ